MNGEDLRPLRAVIAVGQLLTLAATWPLWQLRVHPPLLPLLAVPLPMGWVLALSVLSVMRWPRAGALLHAVLLLCACLLDVTRFAPVPLSLALLLLATSHPRGLPVARAHLGSLWLWAGVGKLVSPGFSASLSPALFGALPDWIPARQHTGLLLGLLEVTLAVLSLWPSAHHAVARLGPALHLLILLVLVRLEINPGIWAWNATLAVASALLYRHASNERSVVSARIQLTRAVLLLSPALYYLGWLHPSLAHQLYTGATPTTLTCSAEGCQSDEALREGLDAFGVPVPPSASTLRWYFLATCTAGDRWILRSRLPGAGYDEAIEEAVCPGVSDLPIR